jgi:hypothetical protein
MRSFKKALTKEGVKPKKEKAGPADPGLETKKIPQKRLLGRLALARYDRDAPLVPFTVKVNEYRVPLKMHIGSPCKAVVEKGANVTKGTVIGTPQGLGALIHAPVSGTVLEVTADTVVLRTEQNT